LEVDILTVGNLGVYILTGCNLEVDILPVGNLEVDVLTLHLLFCRLEKHKRLHAERKRNSKIHSAVKLSLEGKNSFSL
jgi:hypothetical protein